MGRLRFYPYKDTSQSCKAVAEATEAKRLRREGSRFTAKAGDIIINWGSRVVPDFGKALVLNPDNSAVIDKLAFFERTKGTPYVPAYATTLAGVAQAGLAFPLVCRTKLDGKDGEGIVIAEQMDQTVEAPLYVEYRKKTAEYRVHLVRLPSQEDQNGTSILGVQQKLRPRVEKGVDWKVRNYLNGFRYFWSVGDIPVEDSVPRVVLKAAGEVFDMFPELDFGALDIIYHEPTERAYCLEINSAPGLCPKTAEKYAEYFRAVKTLFEEMQNSS